MNDSSVKGILQRKYEGKYSRNIVGYFPYAEKTEYLLNRIIK